MEKAVPDLIDELLDQPNVSLIIEKVQAALVDEAERRKAL